MKIAKVILGTLFLLLAVSCNNALNKSIAEPLTPEEVSQAVKKDPGFSFTYKLVERRDNYLRTTSQKAMWQDLTYGRLHKFINIILGNDFQESHQKEFAQKWESQYGHYKVSADSVCDIWQRYWDTHRATNYVRVDLIDIEKEYMQPPWGGESIVTSRKFVLKVTPLRGIVDGVSFDYDLFEMDEEPSFSDMFSHYHSAEISSPFSAPVIVRDSPTVKFQIDETIKSSDFKTVLSKYKFAFAINYVTVNGKRIDTLALIEATPYAVFEYMKKKDKEKESDFNKEYALKRLVEDVLKKEYESKDTYISEQMNNLCSEIDELAFRFFSL